MLPSKARLFTKLAAFTFILMVTAFILFAVALASDKVIRFSVRIPGDDIVTNIDTVGTIGPFTTCVDGECASLTWDCTIFLYNPTLSIYIEVTVAEGSTCSAYRGMRSTAVLATIFSGLGLIFGVGFTDPSYIKTFFFAVGANCLLAAAFGWAAVGTATALHDDVGIDGEPKDYDEGFDLLVSGSALITAALACVCLSPLAAKKDRQIEDQRMREEAAANAPYVPEYEKQQQAYAPQGANYAPQGANYAPHDYEPQPPVEQANPAADVDASAAAA
eukprot:Clim_evm1s25 gene=Clim_evmTU1s25